MENNDDFDSSGNPIVTLQEALEEYEELEKVSMAVLGASDPSNCSYSKGYLKRQALYACVTCNPPKHPDFQAAGVCLGCSLKCHDGHELVELYTKRNFRCDCGNKKFSDNPCVLQKKEDYNELNSYNQNFTGVYCTCHRPYPDPDESEDSADPMVQCVVCEDWLHTQHAIPGILWADYDDADQSLEMICGSCTAKVDFLRHYGSLQAKEVGNVDVTTIPKVSNAPADEKTEKGAGSIVAVASGADDLETDVIKNASSDKSNEGPEDSSSQDSGICSSNEIDVPIISKSKSDDHHSNIAEVRDECCRDKLPKTEFVAGKGTLWGDGWRKKLCRCTNCKELYEHLKVGFLIEEEDTIESYETVGQANADSDMQRAEESFNKQVDALGRVGQIELVTGYNDMKGALSDFLKEFATNGQVVQEKDILEFFANLRATKRPRLDGTFKY